MIGFLVGFIVNNVYSETNPFVKLFVNNFCQLNRSGRLKVTSYA